MKTEPFVGANVALIHQGSVLCYLRDEKPGLPFAGMWDLPGGGREGLESPADCALRELCEEFGLKLGSERLERSGDFASVHPPGSRAWMFTGTLMAQEIDQIRFGDEGQYWRLMQLPEFLAHDKAIGHLQDRLRFLLSGG